MPKHIGFHRAFGDSTRSPSADEASRRSSLIGVSPTELPPQDVDLDAFDLVLDVRPNPSGARIPGSASAPIDLLTAAPSDFITAPDARILTVCDVGMRSLVATRQLQAQGFVNVTSLQGGIDRWTREGYRVDMPDGLSHEELARYDRQVKLPEIGASGQRSILDATVSVVGAGGLGAPVIAYLAGAGVGSLRIIDGDTVEVSNLQRQPLYTTQQASEPKAASAAAFATALNPTIDVADLGTMISETNAVDLLAGSDVIVDATDRFDARYAINDAAMRLGVPLVTGAVYRWEGQLMTAVRGGPCYRCVFPEPPDSDLALDCALTGVVGSVVGAIGSMQATEVIRVLTRSPGGLEGRLVLFDGRDATTTSLVVSRRDGCPACGS